MDCKITFSKSSQRAIRAFSLVEVMWATAITTIVVAAVASTILSTGRSFQGLNNYVDLDDKSRRALDVMMTDIRSATFVTNWTTSSNELWINDANRALVKYQYSASTKKLTRTDSISTRTLLTSCSDLAFTMYRRTPPTNGLDWTFTTNRAQCKLVQVKWKCSRGLYPLGTNWNTESVQTAKIVIRNEPSL